MCTSLRVYTDRRDAGDTAAHSAPPAHVHLSHSREGVFSLKSYCLRELFMKQQSNVPIPTVPRSSCGTAHVSMLISSPDVACVPKHLLHDVFVSLGKLNFTTHHIFVNSSW